MFRKANTLRLFIKVKNFGGYNEVQEYVLATNQEERFVVIQLFDILQRNRQILLTSVYSHKTTKVATTTLKTLLHDRSINDRQGRYKEDYKSKITLVFHRVSSMTAGGQLDSIYMEVE